MNGGENMSRKPVTRSFVVSMVAILTLFAIPLMHCSTTATPATDTGVRTATLGGTGECVPSDNPNNPVICVAKDGSVMPNPPDGLKVHNNDKGVGVPITWKTTEMAALTISLNCAQISTPICKGQVCASRTATTTTGPCEYTPRLDGQAGADPIIITDQCCPIYEPAHR
jgi:hypothetical protein